MVLVLVLAMLVITEEATSKFGKRKFAGFGGECEAGMIMIMILVLVLVMVLVMILVMFLVMFLVTLLITDLRARKKRIRRVRWRERLG